jgi:hypothetical protein
MNPLSPATLTNPWPHLIHPSPIRVLTCSATLRPQVQTDFPTIIDESPRRVLWKLGTCEDFFDRDHDALVIDVENQTLKFAWDIAASGAEQKEIRVWRNAALALRRNEPLPAVTEDDVYRMILPGRDLRSTELQRILSCSHPHIATLRPHLVVTREPLQADGPNAFTVFSRASIVAFLRSRRLS